MRAKVRTGVIATTLTITALILTACSSGGPAGDGAKEGQAKSVKSKPVTLNVDIGGNSNDIALQYAIEKGYFSDEGLTVKASTAYDSTQEIPLLLNGQLQVGLTNVPTVAAAVSQGLRIQFVAAGVYDASAGNSFAGILAGPSSGISSLKDLDGKTLAVPGLTGSSALLAYAAITKGGGDLSKIKLVNLAQPDIVPAIKSGKVAAGMEVEPFVTSGKQSGLKVISYPDSYALPGQMFSGWVMSQSFIQQHPDVVSRFVKALDKADTEIAADIKTGGTAARQIMLAHTPTTAALVKSMTLPTFSGKPLTDSDIAQELTDVYKYKIAKKRVDASQLISSAGTK